MREDEEWSAADLDAAQRSLVEALAVAGANGNDVVIDTAAGRHRGRIVHVGESVIGLTSVAAGRVDLAIEHVVGAIVSRRPGTATSISTGHPRTLTARLREAVQSEEVVELQRIDSSAVRGQVNAVATDHVVMCVGGDDVFVPLAAIVAVSTG